MKRLLSAGSGDIFYLGHVYRKGEQGRLHHPEFTMIEWYRVGMSFAAFIEEVCAMITLFLGPLPIQKCSYRDVFLHYTHLDPWANPLDVFMAAKQLNLAVSAEAHSWDRDTWLHFFLSHVIEPHLGKNQLTVLYDYPPDQAALAQTIRREGLPVAERFEIYYQGTELANGYHELSDPREQRSRFAKENLYRMQQGKDPYPIDELFLAALERLPDCCGASVGLDRLILLRKAYTTLQETFLL